MSLTWLSMMMMSLLMTVPSMAVNRTADLQLSQHWDQNFEGKFCYQLPDVVVGYEVIMTFSQPVKELQNWMGDWLVQRSSDECDPVWGIVNQDIHGLQKAGEFCVRLQGKICGSGDFSGQAVLVDLTVDSQTPPVIPSVAGLQSTKYNYVEVLEKSIMFYQAQRSGKLPADNRIPWRHDSGLQDQGDNGEDLTGGWYDAGDNVKFNFPMAWSTTVLCWSLLEYKEAYKKAGQLEYMYDSIRWPLEYLVKCHTAPNELYVQVGDGGRDHGSWTSPELMDPNRPSFKVTVDKPGSDVVDETAAAMACGYLVFKEKDPHFAETLLTHSEQLYKFAALKPSFYSDAVPQASAYYRSNNYTDEISWAAMWLNKATGEDSYLEEAKRTYLSGAAWGFSWDEKNFGNMVLLYDATHEDLYRDDIVATMQAWSPEGGMDYTPKCLAWRLQWGALRYSSNTAFVALLAADRGIQIDEFRQWAMCQIHYALGDTGRSYVVGFGVNPPKNPHHRASSCPSLPAPCGWEPQRNPGPNPHTLYGALVGGPGLSDDYKDDRMDYVHNEVACDYNAGFQGAISALLQLAIDHELPDPSQCGTC